MRKNALYTFLLVLYVLLVCSPMVMAGLPSDSVKIAHWFSKELGNLLAFQASSTHFLPGDTVGFPGVEVGIAGGASAKKLDVTEFRNLPFDTLNSGEINIPASIAAPMGVFHAKVGIPGGWDLGLKGGSVGFKVNSGDAKTEFKNKVFGIEVRKRLLDGMAFPDISVSMAYDNASGDLTRTELYNGPVTGGNLNANTTWKSEWNVGGITARAVVSKKFFVITPFVGVGLTKLTGHTDTSVDTAVNSGPVGIVSGVVRGSAKNKDTLGHALAGLELTPVPFFKLGLGGLVAKDHWAASLNMRVQFP
jgi:hypothetical protein